MSRPALMVLAGAIGLIGVGTAPAAAQTLTSRPSATWSISARGALSGRVEPLQGTLTAPPAGEPFIVPAVVAFSRTVSSWQFGDGALLFNQAAASGGSRLGIVPIDQVFEQPLSEPIAIAGVSVGRRVWRRLHADFSVDYQQRRLLEASQAIADATRGSFVAGFEAFPVAFTREASSNLEVHTGRELFAAGLLRLSLLDERRRVVPHVVGGVGWMLGQREVSLTLASEYRLVTASALTERDTVTIAEIRTLGAIGTIGAGATVGRNRVRLRVEALGRFSRPWVRTTLSATPERSGAGGQTLYSLGAAAMAVFSTASSQRSSLSAPPIHDFVTFEGSALEVQPLLTAGLVFAF